MKRILQNSFGKTILCLLVALMSGGTACATSYYVSQAKVAAVGEGTVYVTKNSTSTSGGDTSSTQDENNQNHVYYFYAKANSGYYFEGWHENAQCSDNAVSSASPYRYTIHVNYKGERNAVGKTLWAQFLQKHAVEFNTSLSIPYGSDYTLKIGTSGTADVKTDGSISSVSVTGNDKIASVSGSTITPLAVGTTAITVTSAEGDTYLAGGPAEITINVTAPEGVSETPGDEYTETYTIPSSGYGTYCSQYPIDFTRSFENDETAYTVREMTETLVKLKKIEETSIKGGVGFVVKGTPGTTITFRFTDSSNVPTPNMLFGIIAPTYIEQESAYGMKNGSFHPNNAGVVPAHRAYLPVESSGSVKALSLDFEEEDPTGIEEFKFEDDSNAVIYNLSGQRINKMQRGINIVNGKKILK